MYAFVTPDAATGDIACRRVLVPVELLPAVLGALDTMTEESSWEQLGTMTPAEAAALAADIVDSYLSSGEVCMIGSLLHYVSVNPPSGVLPCDGSTYLRVDYPELYAILDPSLVIDVDTFVTPDLQGRTLIGVGAGSGLSVRALGDVGGSEQHQLSIPEMPRHRHPHHQHGIDIDMEQPAALPQPVTGYALPGQTGWRGNDQPHENMPPFYAAKVGLVAR